MEMKSTKNKLFLLDAYALIFRAYYAFIKNPRINSKGLNTSAIFGFVNALEDILTKEKPSHIAIVFDPPGGTFRNEIYPEYKANRDATPEDIKKAVPYIKEIAGAYGIPVIEEPGFEADDVIGTLARKAEKAGLSTFMMTPDKDFAQLVTENTYMYKPARGGGDVEVLGVEEVKKKFSIDHPEQVIEILALWGDASDNIPGAPGIGEKTSQKLIAEYKNIEGVFKHLDQLKGKQRENIENNRKQIELSKTLATIETNAPVEFNIEELKLDEPSMEKLKSIFQELEFRNTAERIFRRIQAEPGEKNEVLVMKSEEGEPNLFPATDGLENIKTTRHDYRLISSKEALLDLVEMLKKQPSVCIDTETTGLDPLRAELVGVAISCRPFEAYFIEVSGERGAIEEFLQPLKIILENIEIEKIGQNIKYDIQVLEKYGILFSGPIFDTMLAHYLLEPDQRHNLNLLSEKYLRYSPVKIEELIGVKGAGSFRWQMFHVKNL